MIAAHNKHIIYAAVCAVALIGCQRGSDETKDSAAESSGTQSVAATTSDNAQSPAQLRTVSTSDTRIPYPVYPNGTQYSAGKEDGLEVVLFQTRDGFEKVDDFYRRMADDTDMPRLAAMEDYVRYTVATDDKDPWETSTPGIVIHRFNDDAERAAVGADAKAVTNIIMSF
ncbi:MAG: hypothetical protein AB8B63_01505 [Granulosicoccus sp.]